MVFAANVDATIDERMQTPWQHREQLREGCSPTKVCKAFPLSSSPDGMQCLADTLWKLGRKEGVNAEGNENLNPSTLQGQLTWFMNRDYNEVCDDGLLRYIPCVRRS